MNGFQNMVPPDPKRLYRNRKERVIAGVAAGVADYLGWDKTLVRLAWVVSLFIAAPFTFFAYIVMWMVMPEAPTQLFANETERSFWQSVNSRPRGTVGDLNRTFADLDQRLAKMERRVTSPDFTLDREFRNLGA